MRPKIIVAIFLIPFSLALAQGPMLPAPGFVQQKVLLSGNITCFIRSNAVFWTAHYLTERGRFYKANLNWANPDHQY